MGALLGKQRKGSKREDPTSSGERSGLLRTALQLTDLQSLEEIVRERQQTPLTGPKSARQAERGTPSPSGWPPRPATGIASRLSRKQDASHPIPQQHRGPFRLPLQSTDSSPLERRASPVPQRAGPPRQRQQASTSAQGSHPPQRERQARPSSNEAEYGSSFSPGTHRSRQGTEPILSSNEASHSSTSSQEAEQGSSSSRSASHHPARQRQRRKSFSFGHPEGCRCRKCQPTLYEDDETIINEWYHPCVKGCRCPGCAKQSRHRDQPSGSTSPSQHEPRTPRASQRASPASTSLPLAQRAGRLSGLSLSVHRTGCRCLGCRPEMYNRDGTHKEEMWQTPCTGACQCAHCDAMQRNRSVTRSECSHYGHKLPPQDHCKTPFCRCKIGCSDPECTICNYLGR
jgi:hypothetical protein